MKGVQYVIDDKGQRRAVIIDLKKHGKLWEDFQDLIVSRERENEPRESFEEVETKLRAMGKLK